MVLPAVTIFRLQTAIGSADQGFAGWAQLFSLLPGRIGVLLRHAFFRQACGGCKADAHIGFGSLFSHRGVSIGRSAYIGSYCLIGEVAIEDDVLIASGVSIMNGCQQHGTERLDAPIREQPGIYQQITIGANSWIGERAVIAASVGRHCIVGAGSLVLKPLPDYSVAVGSPARVIRNRRPDGDDHSADSGYTKVTDPALASTAESASGNAVDLSPVETAEFAMGCLKQAT